MAEEDPAPGLDDPPGPAQADVLANLATGAAAIGLYRWDLRTGRLHWDATTAGLFGYGDDPGTRTFEDFERRLDPAHRPAVLAALEDAVASRGSFDLEYRVVLPDGTARWVAARGRVLTRSDGAPTHVLGAVFDRTARHGAEEHAARVLEAIPTAFFSVDPDWRFTYVNAEAERLLERTREEMIGGDLWDLFPAAAGSDFERHYRGAMGSGVQVSFEAHYPAPLDRWYEVRAWPGPFGLAVYFLDVTARRQAQGAAERAAAEARRAAERASLGAAVSADLAATLDPEEAVARLARLLVPTVADWCVVSVLEEGHDGSPTGALRDIATRHADPRRQHLVERYAARRLAALREQSFLRRSITRSETVLVPRDATRVVGAVLVPGEARDLLEALAPEWGAAVPLQARGRTLGALTLFGGPDRPALADDDVAHVEDIAHRAALALDNARLYRQQRRLAEGLQRSMLSDPPSADELEVVARYEPAAEAAQVGGDWYDAFLQTDGATVLVVGDVAGHDLAAASTMGQLRSLLRGIAVTTGSGPAGVLGEVDRALAALRFDVQATAVVARIEQTPAEGAAGATRITWSNAGHPPPVVLRPDGSVVDLTGATHDLLLGVLPGTRRTANEITVERGSTVVLYTDGLVESRERPLRAGIRRLHELLAELAPARLGLQALCDELLARLAPPERRDDVALVAVRLHPQGVAGSRRPADAAAGPSPAR